MALSPADQARLTALQTAYDRLLTGRATTEVTYNGQTTKWAQADKAGLKAEIDLLLGQNRRRTRGALGFRV